MCCSQTPDRTGRTVHGTGGQLGSTRALIDQSGINALALYVYSPYGAAVHTGSLATPFQFAGQYTDAESGLQYLRTRYYEPLDGQFLSVDPLVSLTQEPYSYAGDAPLAYADPTGEFWWIVAGCAIGAAAGGVASYIDAGGHPTAQQVIAGGAVAGCTAAVAGPLAGTFSLWATGSATGAAATAGTIALSAGAAAGQAVTNYIDPCDQGSILTAALFGAAGGASASRVPVRGLATWRQARYFAPRTVGGLVRTPNARRLLASSVVSAGFGMGYNAHVPQ